MLQQKMTARGMTQQDAAKLLKVSRLSVNQLLGGSRRLTLNMAIRIERVFNWPARELLILQLDNDLDAERKWAKTRPIKLATWARTHR